jgi:hypothetical protein
MHIKIPVRLSRRQPAHDIKHNPNGIAKVSSATGEPPAPCVGPWDWGDQNDELDFSHLTWEGKGRGGGGGGKARGCTIREIVNVC